MSTIVYKYRLWAPTENSQIVNETFERAVDYYNALVSIENRRRAAYLASRTEMFPEVASLEQQEAELVKQLAAARQLIKVNKSETRSRDVSEVSQMSVAAIQKSLKSVRSLLREHRHAISLVSLERSLPKIAKKREKLEARGTKCQADAAALPEGSKKDDASRIYLWCLGKMDKLDKSRKSALKKIAKLQEGGRQIDVAKAAELAELSDQQSEISAQAVRDLRKTLYWGTYLLVEDAVKRSKASTPGFLAKKTLPLHQQSGRIGTQIIGGIGASELEDDTRVQLTTDGKNGVLKLRVGTLEDGRSPLWASFPIRMHRPLPKDAKITWAIVTRRPGHLTKPWIYHLCLTVQTSIVAEQKVPIVKRGTCAVNFGWRLVENEDYDKTLRIATLNNDTEAPAHLELPHEIFRRFGKCKGLQKTIDDNFNEIKKIIGVWISEQKETLPPLFLEDFANLAHWRQTKKLADLVRYWHDHRIDGDEAVFASAWHWRGRWFHLFQWLTCNRQKALRSRLDFYRNTAKKIASSSEKVVVEAFDISQVAKRPEAEQKDSSWQAARENRTRASCHELRLCIIQACSRYHTEVVLVRASNNTRRCNVCGKLLIWDPAKELERDCPECSTWDQDVNNTDNSHDRVARGEVATLVSPGKVEGNLEISGSQTRSYRSARRELPKDAESQDL